MSHRNRSTLVLGALFLCAVVVVIAVVSVFRNERVQAVKDQQIAAGRQKLSEWEGRDVAASQAQIDATLERLQPTPAPTPEATVQPTAGVPPTADLSDKEGLRKRFQDAQAVVVGDSITEGLDEYGYLTRSNVVHDRGVSVAEADQLLATAVGLQPRVVFLSFGMNDLEYFNGNADRFVTSYEEQIAKVQRQLPGVKVYVNSILPMKQKAIDEKPLRAHREDYNAALQAMCQRLDIPFIDNSGLVQDDWYASDGIHLSRKYYPYWMQHMIEVAGL